MVKNKMASAEVDPRQDSNQQSESSRQCNQHQETIEALTLEAEQLKAKLEEERAKLCDVECNYSLHVFFHFIYPNYPLTDFFVTGAFIDFNAKNN